MIFALETATPRLQISTGREARVSSSAAANEREEETRD
jgi:hypothetical protein